MPSYSGSDALLNRCSSSSGFGFPLEKHQGVTVEKPGGHCAETTPIASILDAKLPVSPPTLRIGGSSTRFFDSIHQSSSMLRPISMHHGLSGPRPRQDTVRIRVRVVRLITRLARTVYPRVVVRARYLVDLPGI